MGDDDFPANPITALAEAAVQLHELFVSLVHAGFTEVQALHLVAAVIAAGTK